MPIVQLPINWGLNKAIEEVGLKSYGAALQDCFIDEQGNIHRRPGLSLLCDVGTSAKIDGLFWWDEQGWVIAVSNGNTFKITDINGTKANITGDTFQVGTRVKFGNYGTALYAANGARIVKIPSSGNTVYVGDADAPTVVTHVVVLDKYLIANEAGSERFHFAVVATPDTWEGDFASAETKPDQMTALLVTNMELNLMGKQTLEAWRDDGQTPFVRELQGFIESGTLAPYSFEVGSGIRYWLDHERNIVRMPNDLRTPQILSIALNKYLQGFSTVTDAIGDCIVVGGRAYYIITFPTEEKTLVWDIINQIWYEWGYWDSVNAVYKNWLANCYCLATAWNMALVGDKNTGKIYKLDPDNYDDNSNIIRTLIRTPHINHDTENIKKRSHSLTFRVKRTNVEAEASITNMTVRWRDDGSSTWGNERTVALGQVGDTEFRGQLRRMGMYHSRQYEFVLSDDTPLCLVSVEEKFDYMNN